MRSRYLVQFQSAVTVLFLGGFLAGFAAAEEPDPRALLKRMSDAVGALETFRLSGDVYADARMDAGLIIEHASQATLRARKPDFFRLTNQTEEETKEVYYESGTFTMFTTPRNLYAQTDLPDDAESPLDYATEEIGIDAPMLDFVSSNVAELLLEDATDVQYLGRSLVRERIYDHVAIRMPEIDVQIWIASDGPALPGKMALSAKWSGGAPRTVVFMHWETDPDFEDSELTFDPPAGATKIDLEARPSERVQ